MKHHIDLQARDLVRGTVLPSPHRQNVFADYPDIRRIKAGPARRPRMAVIRSDNPVYGVHVQFLDAGIDRTVQDREIVKKIARLLEQIPGVTHDQIRVEVDHGWVTLTGPLDWNYQRARIIAAIRLLRNVEGLIDELVIRPRARLTLAKSKLISYNTALHHLGTGKFERPTPSGVVLSVASQIRRAL